MNNQIDAWLNSVLYSHNYQNDFCCLLKFQLIVYYFRFFFASPSSLSVAKNDSPSPTASEASNASSNSSSNTHNNNNNNKTTTSNTSNGGGGSYDSLSYEKLLDETTLSTMSKAKQTALIIKTAFKRNSAGLPRTVEDEQSQQQQPQVRSASATTTSSSSSASAINLNVSPSASSTTSSPSPSFAPVDTALLSSSSSPSSNNKSTAATAASPVAAAATVPRKQLIMINWIGERLLLSGEIGLVKSVMALSDEDEDIELETQGQVHTSSRAGRTSKYVDKLDVSRLIHMVELMERLYEMGFALEACHALGNTGSSRLNAAAASDAKEAKFHEYIFIKNSNCPTTATTGS